MYSTSKKKKNPGRDIFLASSYRPRSSLGLVCNGYRILYGGKATGPSCWPHNISLHRGSEWNGAVPPSPLCACKGRSWGWHFSTAQATRLRKILLINKPTVLLRKRKKVVLIKCEVTFQHFPQGFTAIQTMQATRNVTLRRFRATTVAVEKK